MSNGKSKEEIRKKFLELNWDIDKKRSADRAPDRAPMRTLIDVKQFTLETKDDLRKFRKKL